MLCFWNLILGQKGPKIGIIITRVPSMLQKYIINQWLPPMWNLYKTRSVSTLSTKSIVIFDLSHPDTFHQPSSPLYLLYTWCNRYISDSFTCYTEHTIDEWTHAVQISVRYPQTYSSLTNTFLQVANRMRFDVLANIYQEEPWLMLGSKNPSYFVDLNIMAPHKSCISSFTKLSLLTDYCYHYRPFNIEALR